MQVGKTTEEELLALCPIEDAGKPNNTGIINCLPFARLQPQVRVSTGLPTHHFDIKQFREYVDLPLTYHPFPKLTTFSFWSNEVRRLVLDLDTHVGTDTLGMFPIFLKRTADVLAPRLRVVFRRLVRLSRFPACWIQRVHRPPLLPTTERFP